MASRKAPVTGQDGASPSGRLLAARDEVRVTEERHSASLRAAWAGHRCRDLHEDGRRLRRPDGAMTDARTDARTDALAPGRPSTAIVGAAGGRPEVGPAPAGGRYR